jgi:long-chain fatty acid transport protein
MNGSVWQARGLLAVGLALAAGGVSASGFAIQEKGITGLGQAFAGAAAVAEDASTIWFNPAGLGFLERDEVAAGIHWIIPWAEFTDGGSTRAGGRPLGGATTATTDTEALVPNFYVAKAVTDAVRVGVGINAPFGLVTEYDPTWVGRYHAIKSDLMTININPTLAYKVSDQLALAVGFNALYADIELSQAIDQLTISRGVVPDDGRLTLSGDDWGFGYNLGLMLQATPTTRLGFAYRSEIAVEPSGTADFEVDSRLPLATGGRFVDTGVSSQVDLPRAFSASLAQDLGEQWTVLGDITWTGWSSFPELRFQFDNPLQSDGVTTVDWDDAMRYSLGVHYRYDDALTLRVGVAYDETPVPSAERRTPRVPDADRTWIAIGASYRPWDDLYLDVGYTHIFVDDASVDNTLESSIPALQHTLRGTYESRIDILSAGLRYTF